MPSIFRPSTGSKFTQELRHLRANGTIAWTILAAGLVALAPLTQAQAAGTQASRSVVATKVHFLKTRGPHNARLMCFLDGNAVKLGVNPKVASGAVTYALFRPTPAQKRIAATALTECRAKLKAPACKDG